jgi:hypothetical protein
MTVLKTVAIMIASLASILSEDLSRTWLLPGAPLEDIVVCSPLEIIEVR